MTDMTLSKAETKLLLAAAGQEDGLFVLPATMKPGTRERMLGRFVRDGLAVAAEDGAGHQLTPAGYRVLGLRPPRAKRAATAPAGAGNDAAAAKPPSKQALIVTLLGRGEGASLVELTDATGWLPHTARAALSRLRSGGKVLAKSKREDGTTAYRIVPDEPVRRTRKARAEVPAQATA